MNTNEHESAEDKIIFAVVGAAYEVSNVLGTGFLEKVYERALIHELELRGLKVTSQVSVAVVFKGHNVGNYVADLVVEDSLIVERKCAERLISKHTAQCLNYLRASGLKYALLFNFQRTKLEWKRFIY